MIANYSSWIMKGKENEKEGGRKREESERRREKTKMFENWKAKEAGIKGQDTGEKENALR